MKVYDFRLKIVCTFRFSIEYSTEKLWNNGCMLGLNSPQWKQLQHAYGSAEGIPRLLEQLLSAPEKPEDYLTEPWFSLWSALCHQGDVYSAFYAAVPHIVQSASLKAANERLDAVHLAMCIEASRNRKAAPKMPDDLAVAYFQALQQLRLLICESLLLKLATEDEAKILLGGLAIVDGLPNFGMAVLELPEPNACPNCETYVPPLGYDLE